MLEKAEEIQETPHNLIKVAPANRSVISDRKLGKTSRKGKWPDILSSRNPKNFISLSLYLSLSLSLSHSVSFQFYTPSQDPEINTWYQNTITPSTDILIILKLPSA